MKHPLISISIGALAALLAILYFSQPQFGNQPGIGRYQLIQDGSAFYRLDTATGEIEFCAPDQQKLLDLSVDYMARIQDSVTCVLLIREPKKNLPLRK